jgi:uncharacterized phage protein gp47/JayE
MPWSTPSLKQVRSLVRDAVQGSLPGADANVPNSVLRVLSDVMGALCHLVLQYVEWLSRQLLPDTAEKEWLDRHGNIWLTNADGSIGRKLATPAIGQASFTAQTVNVVVPAGTLLTYLGTGVSYATTVDTAVNTGVVTPAPIIALESGSAGNLPAGTMLSVAAPVPAGLIPTATVILLERGTDDETDDELRARVLQRIREPPMGGDANDYVQWALSYPGVTRAWCAPQEMGIGTVSVRFLMDDLRADNDGWPTGDDIQAVTDYLNSVRPVAIKDFFVMAPVKQPVDVYIIHLTPDTPSVRASIEQQLKLMLHTLAAPGQTIYAAWKSAAIMNAPNVQSFDLLNTEDDVMQSPGHMAVLGNIIYQ